MIRYSEQYRAISNKVYTFDLIALAIKYLPFTNIDGMEVNEKNSAILIGAFGVLAILLTVATTIYMVRDVLQTRQYDELQSSGTRDPVRSAATSLRDDGFKYAEIYLFFARCASAIEAFTPIILTIIVTLVGWEDIGKFCTIIVTKSS
ncbi:hypothetical protein [Kordiimonas sp.]|uniref:hypothetical protein n=1 Tax=Kordiimonas sp. TaxID=1970157 RepID=UPI003A8F32D1